MYKGTSVYICLPFWFESTCYRHMIVMLWYICVQLTLEQNCLCFNICMNAWEWFEMNGWFVILVFLRFKESKELGFDNFCQ